MPDTDSVPEIDLGCDDEQRVAEQIVDALTTIGFFFVKNHGIQEATIDEMFAQSVGFFGQSLADKQRMQRDWRSDRCGYIPLSDDSNGADVERFSLDAPPDIKEVLDVCHNCRRWPSSQLESASRSLIAEAQQLVLRLLQLLGRGLRLQESDELVRAFADFGGAGNTSKVRLLHYPPCAEACGGMRCGEHTDYDCFTLVFADTHPGLQAAPLKRTDVIKLLAGTVSGARIRLQGLDLCDADLSQLDLSGANLSLSSLRGANLQGADLSNCVLSRADCTGASFDKANMSGVLMRCAVLDRASMVGVFLEASSEHAAANLEGSSLREANLENSHLQEVNLRVTCLKGARLTGCNLRAAVLAGSDLENADLSGCDLQQANLRGANVINCVFGDLRSPLHMTQTLNTLRA